MSHIVTTKPYWCLTQVANDIGMVYGCSDVGTELACNPHYVLNSFDTEPELADFVDAQVGEPGYYYRCDNRIPYPPNLVEWSYPDCIDPDPEP
jgi:hypothetical protein